MDCGGVWSNKRAPGRETYHLVNTRASKLIELFWSRVPRFLNKNPTMNSRVILSAVRAEIGSEGRAMVMADDVKILAVSGVARDPG